MTETDLTIVTAPDYVFHSGDRVVVFGGDSFCNDIKNDVYELWYDRPVTLYCFVPGTSYDTTWLLNVLGTAHFVIVEIAMGVLPGWLVELISNTPRVYFATGKGEATIIMIAKKDAKLVAYSTKDAVERAMKALA